MYVTSFCMCMYSDGGGESVYSFFRRNFAFINYRYKSENLKKDNGGAGGGGCWFCVGFVVGGGGGVFYFLFFSLFVCLGGGGDGVFLLLFFVFVFGVGWLVGWLVGLVWFGLIWF